jgi:predicted GNAT family acetyltransferase
MSHVLDRPVWNALAGRHAALAEGGPLARRYPPAVIPFGAARDESEASLRALADLLAPGEEMMIAEAAPLAIPTGPAVQATATVVQMILTHPLPVAADDRITHLTEDDADEMLALATLCRPGPFTRRAQALGEFRGIRIDGRLAAMAGTRMRQEGHAEISGVSTHPDFRGRGLARVLSVFMARRFIEAGDTPYLHAYATNTAAIGLYESIGFEIRTTLNVAVIRAYREAHAS